MLPVPENRAATAVPSTWALGVWGGLKLGAPYFTSLFQLSVSKQLISPKQNSCSDP